MSQLRIALIGAGAMGSLHARVIAQSERATLVCVVDPDRESGEALAERWRSSWTPDLDSFQDIDGVIVASPTSAHVEWASRALDNDTPVLVEKPISDDLLLTEALLARASARAVPLMCGFQERFNAALCTALEIIEEPLFVMTSRHSHHLARINTGVSYDLLIHDVDLVLRMAGRMPDSLISVSRIRTRHPEPKTSRKRCCGSTTACSRHFPSTASRNARCAQWSSTSSNVWSRSTSYDKTSLCTGTSRVNGWTDRMRGFVSRP